jgi:hypothetical protein
VRLVVVVVVVVAFFSVACPTKFDCCREGKIAECECPYQSDCIVQPFTDCGDGTCIDGAADAVCDDGE